MAISVKRIELHVLNMKARMPFRYGIASLVAVPHLFVRATVDVNGRTEKGLAADGLPPKWFTKNPEASFADDLEEMFAVIRHACTTAPDLPAAETVFAFWQTLYARQQAWAAGTAYPPLLWAFGVSLVERAVLDAFCRARGTPLAQAVRENALGIRLGEIHGTLSGFEPADLLPEAPRRSVIARHTVGLTDPLTDAEIPAADRLDDGLPQSLEANLRAYGLTHLKIKLCGDAAKDLARLKRIAELLGRGTDYAFTLDGNEQYTEVAPFRALWDALVGDPSLAPFLDRLIFVEQPLRRDVALSPQATSVLRAWSDRPPMIIDESDGTLSSVMQALEGGYVGTSHKNCKGIFKGIANACLIAHRRRSDPDGQYVLSSEDLGNVGPVALMQDLAVAAGLGVCHTERNGHHYFAGLSMYPRDVQEDVLAHHGTLYRRHEQGGGQASGRSVPGRGFPTLDIRAGVLDVGSVVDAPFGYGFDLDSTRFTPLEAWTASSLGI